MLLFSLPCAATSRRAPPQAPPQTCEALHSPSFKGECSGTTFGSSTSSSSSSTSIRTTTSTSTSTSTSDDDDDDCGSAGFRDVDSGGMGDASQDSPKDGEEEEEEEGVERRTLVSREEKGGGAEVDVDVGSDVDVGAKKASELWRIHGRYFDLSTFLDHHPVRQAGRQVGRYTKREKHTH